MPTTSSNGLMFYNKRVQKVTHFNQILSLKKYTSLNLLFSHKYFMTVIQLGKLPLPNRIHPPSNSHTPFLPRSSIR